MFSNVGKIVSSCGVYCVPCTAYYILYTVYILEYNHLKTEIIYFKRRVSQSCENTDVGFQVCNAVSSGGCVKIIQRNLQLSSPGVYPSALYTVEEQVLFLNVGTYRPPAWPHIPENNNNHTDYFILKLTLNIKFNGYYPETCSIRLNLMWF